MKPAPAQMPDAGSANTTGHEMASTRISSCSRVMSVRAASKAVCVARCCFEVLSSLALLDCTVETLVRVWVRRTASTRRGGHPQLFSQRGDGRLCLFQLLLRRCYRLRELLQRCCLRACSLSLRVFECLPVGGGRFEICLHTPGALQAKYRPSMRALDSHSTGTVQPLDRHRTGIVQAPYGHSMRALDSHEARIDRDLTAIRVFSDSSPASFATASSERVFASLHSFCSASSS